jgi:hypothetical protein
VFLRLSDVECLVDFLCFGTMYTAVVVGHSFVRRAGDFARVSRELISPNLGLSDFQIHWLGYGGLRVDGLGSDEIFTSIAGLQPSVLILDIGTNDLGNLHLDPFDLAKSVIAIAGGFYHCFPSIQCVYILEVCRRENVNGRRPPGFNQRVHQYNRALSSLCGVCEAPIVKCSLKGITADYRRYLSSDGVHLSSRPSRGCSHSGIFKYLMVIKSALGRASRRLGVRL